MVLGSWGSQAALRHGIHQQRQGHHHAQPCNAVGLFAKQRRDKQQRVFETPQAPFDVRLAFVGGHDRGSPPRAGVDLGAQYLAGLGLLVRLAGRVITMDVGLEVPRAGLERRACCGAPFASVALVCGQRRGLDAGLPPALGQR